MDKLGRCQERFLKTFKKDINKETHMPFSRIERNKYHMDFNIPKFVQVIYAIPIKYPDRIFVIGT